MQKNLQANTKPDERNPSYDPDRLNDRWPATQQDMAMLTEDMDALISGLQAAQTADFKQITQILANLFGEKISERSVGSYLGRAVKAGDGGDGGSYIRSTGIYMPTETVVAPAIVRSVSSVPKHNFHCEVVKKKNEQPLPPPPSSPYCTRAT